MEKIMNIWAKISSIGMVYFLISGVFYGIYLAVKLLFSPIQIGLTSMIFFVTAMNALAIITFGPPLFYFAWVKKPKNKQMKLWAKIVTIIFVIYFILGFISPWGLDLFSIILTLFVMIPLYYYAWRK